MKKDEIFYQLSDAVLDINIKILETNEFVTNRLTDILDSVIEDQKKELNILKLVKGGDSED